MPNGKNQYHLASHFVVQMVAGFAHEQTARSGILLILASSKRRAAQELERSVKLMNEQVGSRGAIDAPPAVNLVKLRVGFGSGFDAEGHL